MGKAKIPSDLRQRVERAAGYRCGYCLTPQEITGLKMDVDHILPEAAGGDTVEENLWLACVACNRAKHDQVYGRDPSTGDAVRLFNPRDQRWTEHFAWSPDGTQIVGLTSCGRATVEHLRMNNLDVVTARYLWVLVGWWPPEQ